MQMDLQTLHSSWTRLKVARTAISTRCRRGRLPAFWAAVSCAIALLSLAGCRATPPAAELSRLEALAEETEASSDEQPAPVVEPQQPEAPSTQPPAESPPVSEWKKELASDSWVRTVKRDGIEPPRRWHHTGLAQLLALDESPEATLTAALNADGASTRTNAAIGLALLGKPSGLETLAAGVENRELHQRQRQAAAEAFGEVDDPQTTELVLEIVGRLGQFDPQHQAAYHPDLHAELLRSLSDWHDERVVEVFRQALAAPSTEARLVAIEAWAAHPEHTLPERVVSLREDNDPMTRSAALKALAYHRAEGVERFLESGLRDLDPRVQLAAIEALGVVATDTALDRLRQVLREEQQLFQSAAIDALAQHGDIESVTLAAENDSWRVRLQAAKSLSNFATPEGTLVARKLLSDRSIEVQQYLVESLSQWPLETAGGVLLEAMASETYRTRKLATQKLAEQWPAAAGFMVDENEARRAEALSLLRTQWFTDFGFSVNPPAVAQAEKNTSTGPAKHDQPVTVEQLERVAAVLEALHQPQLSPAERDGLLGQLVQHGPALIPALEQLSNEHGMLIPEPVFSRVLPRVSPLHEAIEALQQESTAERRVAATRLTELSDGLINSELAAERLFEQIIVHNDPLVWRSVLMSLEQSSTNATTQIVCAAAGHPSAEIRRRACEHLTRFPSSDHQALLTAALSDTDTSVILAATAALGASGQMDDLEPLRWQLRSNSDQIQLATAIALVQLDDADGVLALQRLATDDDPGLRIQVASSIGKLGDPKLIPLLIDMLDDRGAVQRTAIDSLEQFAGETTAREIEEEGAGSETRLVAAWKSWAAQQPRTARQPADPTQEAGAR